MLRTRWLGCSLYIFVSAKLIFREETASEKYEQEIRALKKYDSRISRKMDLDKFWPQNKQETEIREILTSN